ncbi:hypothetical protein B5807_11522 [Epicoccum nigrum]|uniref:RING-type domain-containing protein n=1 Tax=Epicoccum nigrum TaxID=105696 RepID=A0A1Y2LJD8_EPING|nr:hypothetical protein B5807_11522 [Epicoccum nigrum]
MSVSVEQPLHFQRSASPTFSSPPRSPERVQHAPTSVSPPPLQQPADVNMSTSLSTLSPTGQRHDREDADMQDGNNLTSEQVHSASADLPVPAFSTVHIEVAATDEDAMDTTPDTNQQTVLPTASTGQDNTLVAQSPSPTANGVDGAELAASVQIEPIATDDATGTSPPPTVPLPLSDPSLQPPPPPPPPAEPTHSDSESSDDEDDVQPWHPIQEDTSSPDEIELKEIEASTEHSALDHEYWESRAFLPVEEPEYKVGVSGRIDWTIEAYNGTRESPNRDIVMKSDPVDIGGHLWQIKFYPKGNDSDYLSVYLECLSVVDASSKKKENRVDSVAKDGSADDMNEERLANTLALEEVTDTEYQHTPLPLLDSKQLPQRKSVAAQVSVVMYNPSEPRVNYSRTALHRFCNGSPDWGWTRFHGPYYDIPHRARGQRQALLRNDKLSFTAYIRTIEDETGCLWEHPSRENPWDSFAMTGLQGLMLGEDASAPGGNMISAIASWMLYTPFRKLLYSIRVPHSEEDPFVRPKPLVSALQKVLYMLRTHVNPGAGSVALDDVLEALEWYGIHDRIDKIDVIETWEVLRAKLEEELHETPEAATFLAMCGPKRDHITGVPSYRVPVVGVDSMQGAIDSSSAFVAPGRDLPELLTVELERQEFDSKTRSYVKLLNKVTLDDQISVNGIPYTLYGFVVHKQTLQSYVYQPILRPGGPGSKWYSYSDSKDENYVKCLTHKQAVETHQGKAGAGQIDGNDPIAYIAMYVRNDKIDATFNTDAESELWDVPCWIKADAEKLRSASIIDPMRPPPPPPTDDQISANESDDQSEGQTDLDLNKTYTFKVIDSRLFLQHEGPGTFEAYDTKWTTGSIDYIYNVELSRQDSCDDIRTKVASVIKDVQDPRQIKFWFLDPSRGSQGRPDLVSTGKVEYSSGSYDRYLDLKQWKFGQPGFASRHLWAHAVDFDDLPPLVTNEDENVQDTIEAPPSTTNDVSISSETAPETTHSNLDRRFEDTPMSEPDEQEQEVIVPVQSRPQTPTTVPPVIVEGVVETMIGIEDVSEGPGAFESSMVDDTEMGGTQHDPPPPPPPVVDLSAELIPPPAAPPVPRASSPKPPADEIYFFLKLFDPEKQVLEARGTYIAKKSARVDETLVKCLGLSIEDKKKIEIWEEEELNTLRSIKNRRSFLQVDLHNTSIIVVTMPLTSEQRSAIAARAAFADLQSFLAYRTFSRNFPSHLNGYFTYDYFSSEYYKGEIKNGHRHGHGKMLYHSGATYQGTFQLGQRHGHGLYTFQNGDTYDGDWVDNQQHGSGTFVEAATGNTYVGGWKNDKKFGEGVTHWKNAQEEERLCRICWEEAADAAFYDCGHVVACLQCAKEVQSCPVCRKRVLCAMKLYYVA